MNLQAGWMANVATADHGPAGCFQRVLIAPFQTLPTGTVLGQLTADPGTFVAFDPAANDGRQVAAAVVSYPIATLDQPEEAMVVGQGPCAVYRMMWAADATPDEIAVATAHLAALGILLAGGSPSPGYAF